MALSDMQKFEEYTRNMAWETIDQQIALFNTASRGCIVLRSGRNVGDITTETFWKKIPGLMRRRDAYGSGTLNPTTMSEDKESSVKVAGGTLPVVFEPQQFTWIKENPEDAGVLFGEQLAEGVLADYINSALGVVSAAIGNNAEAVYDGSAGTMTRGAFVKGAAKFGDRAGDIAAWAMHSTPMHTLFEANVANSEQLFNIGNLNVMQDGFGRVFIVTDAPDLVVAGSPTKFHTLGLTAEAVVIEDNGDLATATETKTGGENIKRVIQAEYTFNAKVKGYSWDKANGGASPDDAALRTGANWDLKCDSIKNTAGVKIITQ